MKISALDIHQKEFGHAMRGYREEEVDDFLDAIAQEIDRLAKENEELIGRVRFAESKLEGLDAERSAITETLLNAQRNADELTRNADEKAEATKRQAEVEGQEIIASANATKRELLNSLKRLKSDEERFRRSYLALLEESIAGVHEIKLPESVISELEPKENSFAAAVARAEAGDAPVQNSTETAFVPEVPLVDIPKSELFSMDEPSQNAHAASPEPTRQAPAVTESAFAPVVEVNAESVVAATPVSSGSVSGLIIGERESDAPIDVSLKEPREFEIPGGYRWGEREDDLVIEEID